jgi:hypothetical protein
MPALTLPGGYRPEEGKGPGDEVKALITMKISEDGTSAEIIDVDGAKFEGMPQPGEKEEKVEAEASAPAEDDASTEAFGARLQSAVSEMKGRGPMM